MLFAIAMWSCESFALVGLVMLVWFAWAAMSAAKKATAALKSEDGKQVARYAAITFFRWFN